MRKFETLLLLSPELSAETREGILTALTGVVERENGVMEEVDHWGMRDLAYPVRKQMRGYYVRLVYQAPAELVAELERNVRITDGIFKFVTVKLAEEVEVYKRPDILRDFITERGKIIARRITGTCAHHQRLLTREIKRARQMALLIYTATHDSTVKKKSMI